MGAWKVLWRTRKPTRLRPQANRNSTGHWRSIQLRFVYTVMDYIRVVSYSYLPHVPAAHRLPIGIYGRRKAVCAMAFPVLLYLNRNTSRCTCAGFSPGQNSFHQRQRNEDRSNFFKCSGPAPSISFVFRLAFLSVWRVRRPFLSSPHMISSTHSGG
jgi:hypothetical protein